jgi:replicative DNA helicase
VYNPGSKHNGEEMIERLILIGFINSTEFCQQIFPVWNMEYFLSVSPHYIAAWALDYFQTYGEAPGRTIEDIYFDKKKSKAIPKEMVDDIHELLVDLAEDYDSSFNVRYIVYRTQKYIKERHLELHREEVDDLIEKGDTEEAQALAEGYVGPVFELLDDLDLGDEEALDRMEKAFIKKASPLIRYSGALGNMTNDQLVRGGFVALMASEKRGKSFWLLDMAFRAVLRKNKVAFFQAGDMTEDQQLLRIASYLTKLPTNKKYIGDVLIPEADCIRNQLDTCDKEERRNFAAVLTGQTNEQDFRKELTRDMFVEAMLDYGDGYRVCTNCDEYRTKRIGSPWYTVKEVTHTVTVEEAKKELKKFFIDKKRAFRISTHPNNTLTIAKSKSILDRWERLYGFIPDVIIYDYADLLVAASAKDFRHQQNEIWKDLRALSQERDCLVITATQSDAKSYEQDLLQMKNFSEDKRKFAHVTAMYGLNQSKDGREKKMGLMRVNELAIREGEFDSTNTVTVLQCLNLGRPFIDSYV